MQCSIDSRVVEGLVTGGPQPPTVETFAAMEFMGSMSMHTQHQATSTNGPEERKRRLSHGGELVPFAALASKEHRA